MPRDIREYRRPADQAGALDSLRQATPLMLGARVPDDLYAGVEAVVDLSRLDLTTIMEDDAGVRVGALTPLQNLADSPLLQSTAGGILAQAALFSAGSALRQAATIGGVLLDFMPTAAGPARGGPPELVLGLIALDARLVFYSGAVAPTTDSIEDCLAQGGTGSTQHRLLIEVIFARPGGSARGALARLARTPRDQAIVAAVAVVDAGQWRLALSGAATGPVRLRSIEQALVGQVFTGERMAKFEADVAAAVDPPSDFRASSEYRRAMSGVLARRAVVAAAAQSA